MNKLNNNQLVKPISKIIKCEQCQCGKRFKEPHWTLIFLCSDCNNNHGRTTEQILEENN